MTLNIRYYYTFGNMYGLFSTNNLLVYDEIIHVIEDLFINNRYTWRMVGILRVYRRVFVFRWLCYPLYINIDIIIIQLITKILQKIKLYKQRKYIVFESNTYNF